MARSDELTCSLNVELNYPTNLKASLHLFLETEKKSKNDQNRNDNSPPRPGSWILDPRIWGPNQGNKCDQLSNDDVSKPGDERVR